MTSRAWLAETLQPIGKTLYLNPEQVLGTGLNYGWQQRGGRWGVWFGVYRVSGLGYGVWAPGFRNIFSFLYYIEVSIAL